MKKTTIQTLLLSLVLFTSQFAFALKDLTEEVEVKFSLSVQDLNQSLKALDFDKEEAEYRDIYFVDTKNLDLYSQNILVRIRQGVDDNSDITVKQRPANPKFDWSSYEEVGGFKCEADMTSQKTVTSCSIKKDVDAEDVDLVLEEEDDIQDLLKKNQKALLEDLGIKVAWSKLNVLGPIKSTAWELETSDGLEVSVEVWKVAAGNFFLEVSSKGDLKDAKSIQAKLEKLIQSKKLSVDSAQVSKTEFALKKLSKK